MASIELAGIGRAFGSVRAVADLSLHVADGEFMVLLGPSGAGKTTTLRLVAGLERPDTGRIRMDGHDITDSLPASRDCAFVFQQYSLYPHLSVFDNLAFPLRSPLRRHAPAEVRRRVEEVAALLHIEGKLARRATELSGGEMQRVAIGRALVRRPRVFLMDEPLSSLDAQLREELRVELRRLQRATGATVIYVTHDHVEATTMADRIGILEQGVLQQVGTPMEVYGDPRTLPVAQRLGSPAINVLPAGWFAGRAPAGTAHVAIRPEDVRLSADGEAPGFQVIECSLVKHQLVAERQGVEVHARVMLDQPLAPGSQARFGFPAEHCLFFDAAGRRIAAPGQALGAGQPRRPMKTPHIIEALEAVQAAILANESQIESLDRAIGDGDHFINVRRGCDVLMALREELAPLPPAAAFGKIGMKLLSTIGGASGPLISSFFIAMGKTLTGIADPDRVQFAAAFAAGVEAIKSRGKADLGEKTMLDVLIPVSRLLQRLAEEGASLAQLCEQLPAEAHRNMLATRDMTATKGRASFLGERALGHIDPGSKTCEVAITAVCETWKETA